MLERDAAARRGRFRLVDGGLAPRAAVPPPCAPAAAAGALSMRIERWAWTGEEDRFVVRAWSPDLGEALRFVTALTPEVRDAVARGAARPFRIVASALRLDRLEASGTDEEAGVPPPWTDRALAGDPLARRLLRRAAERAAALAARGGPSRMLVHLPSLGGGDAGPYGAATYLIRGAVWGLHGLPGLGAGGPVRRGVLDAGRVRLAIETPSDGLAPPPDGATVECEAVLMGEPE